LSLLKFEMPSPFDQHAMQSKQTRPLGERA
jgi:hypothetical protein